MVNDWLKKHKWSRARLCSEDRLSGMRLNHKMHERKGITDEALRSMVTVVNL